MRLPRLNAANPRYQVELLAGLTAAAALVVIAFPLGEGLWLAIPLSILVYAGIVLVTGGSPRSSEPQVAAIDPPEPILELPKPPVPNTCDLARFGLTPREIEIVPRLAHRLTNDEIARELSISTKTVENHVASILAKLGLKSRRDVADFLARNGRALTEPRETGD
jgi:DNA-binding CsgD family transcriptional regulator